MGLVQWSGALETGHPKIDEQHKALIEAFNNLHTAMKQGKGRSEVGKVLEFLKSYTIEHFAMEEGLMAKHNYPDKAKHKQSHGDLVSMLEDMEQKFTEGSSSLTLATMDFLEKIVAHIQSEDRRLAAHIKG